MNFYTIKWEDDAVKMIDQQRLPHKEIYHTYTSATEVAHAIKSMIIRGAPAIGVAGAFGMALAARATEAKTFTDFKNTLDTTAQMLIDQRPTAVNLAWGVKRIQKIYQSSSDLSLQTLQERILTEAKKIHTEDIHMCEQMGRHGSSLIEEGKTYLTHCNAGALATGGQGTALSVFYEAKKQGKNFKVFSSETRPFLQGARLTCWELQKNDIDVTLITDNMVAHLMSLGKIDGVITGSDRIAANGDVANKIGTYGAAILAKEHHIPFYVVAPSSTVDFNTKSGDDIPIEERHGDEVLQMYGHRVAPEKISVLNPAFDVTPHRLITAIITEIGIAKSPYEKSLKENTNQGSPS